MSDQQHKPGDQVKLLITKIVVGKEGRADLFAKGHKYRDTQLFDLSDLLTVSIAPQDVPVGQDVPVRFFAVCQVSEKLNKEGNPYLDVLYLEPAGDVAAQAAEVDLEPIMGALRQVYALIAEVKSEIALLHGDVLANSERLARIEAAIDKALFNGNVEQAVKQAHEAAIAQARQTVKVEPPQPEPTPPVAQTPTAPPPLTDDEARDRFAKMVGPAMRDGQVDRKAVADLTAQVGAKKISWGDAYREICKKVAKVAE